MRKMKPSGVEWIGDIPQEWDIYKLKYLVTYNDEVLDEKTDSDFEFDYIDISSVEYQKGIVSLQRMRFSDAPSRARRIVREKDIIISTVRTYLKAVASIGFLTFPQIASTGFIVLRARNNKALSKFLHYAVLANSFISMVEAHSVGVSYPAINASDVVKIPISIPTLYEQKVIAEFLDRKCAEIDSVISKTKATIEQYKALKQSVITQAVTKGIRPNRPMKDSGIDWIGEIAQDFRLMKLKYVFEILDQFRSPITADQRNQNAEVLYDYFGASGAIDKIDGYTIDDHVMLIGEDGANLRMRNLPLMYEVNGKAWINNHAHILKPKQGMDFYYLFYALESLDINPYITGSAQPKLSQDHLKNIWILVPCYEEQKEISAYLKNVIDIFEQSISRKQLFLKEMESYKKSLIFEYVTGKKEVEPSPTERKEHYAR